MHQNLKTSCTDTNNQKTTLAGFQSNNVSITCCVFLYTKFKIQQPMYVSLQWSFFSVSLSVHKISLPLFSSISTCHVYNHPSYVNSSAEWVTTMNSGRLRSYTRANDYCEVWTRVLVTTNGVKPLLHFHGSRCRKPTVSNRKYPWQFRTFAVDMTVMIRDKPG